MLKSNLIKPKPGYENEPTSRQLSDSQKETLINNSNKLTAELDVIEQDLKSAIKRRNEPNLSNEECIQLDCYMAFTINALYFMNLKLNGIDTSNHDIKNDLSTAKQLMARDKSITESLKAPCLDMPATKRFISAGLHTRFVDMNGVMVTMEQYKRSLEDAKKRAT